MTAPVLLTPETLRTAVPMLHAGQLVAFPTETVYGLGADARNAEACAAIFAAKGRPSFNPLIVHVENLETAQTYAQFDKTALSLAEAFWPGPLTLVLPLRSGHPLSSLVSAGLDTVAIRVPANPVSRALLAAFKGPIAAPSANPSGQISPTKASHVLKGLGDKVAAIIDGGPCTVGLESSIIATGVHPRLLREGGLSREAIEALLGAPLGQDTTPGKVSAPGQLTSHYAPHLPVALNVTTPTPAQLHIGFGPIDGALTLSASGDLNEAAAALFDMLHRADALGRAQAASELAFAPIPNIGLGRAINDRLSRAAAPRPPLAKL